MEPVLLNDFSVFSGVNIFPAPHMPTHMPKIQLSKDVSVTDEFRISMNTWLADFFGWQLCIWKTADGFWMHPEVLKILKTEVSKIS